MNKTKMDKERRKVAKWLNSGKKLKLEEK